MKTNILNSYCIGFDKVMSRTFLRLDSLSILSRQSVLAIFVACLTVLGVGNAWGAEWSYTFTSTPTTWSTASGTTRSMTINSATWSVSTSNAEGSPTTWGTYANSNSSGGIKFGDSGSNYYGTTTLSTDYFSGSLVSSVTVNLLINGSKTTTITVTQGVTIGSPSYGTGAQWHDFTANTNTGTSGTLTLQITTTQAIYIRSIAVTYTAATPRTVTFDKQGGTFDDPSVFTNTNQITEASGGAGVTLPAVSPSSSCASEGWGFYGWATSAVGSSTTTTPAIVGKAGDTYYPSANTPLYAVFAQGEYTKETSSITSGAKYLIVANSTKNYVMTDSYSLNSDDRGEMASAQIDETSSGKYSAASVNAQWCYTIEASSTQYYIRDVKNSSSSNYVDIAFLDWYKQSVDPSDKYDFTLSAGKWKIENNYSYFYFNATDHVFTNDGSNYTQFLLYKAGTINYWSTPSCCEYEVSVSESGSSHITSMAFSESSVATCGDAASRTITITVTPASGYSLFGSTKPVFTKTSGTVTATIGSVTDNGDGTFSYECTFNSNDNGAGTFAISPGQFTNYRTLCCTKYDITLASSGSKTGGTFEVDPAKACEGTEITISATADDGYEFSAWTVTNDDDSDDDVTSTVLDSGEEDDDIVAFDMPAYNITVDAEFTCTEPTISAQPSGGSYIQKESADALSVTASAGTGTVDYQWQSSSDNSSWDDIDGETSSSYTPSTTSTGTMYYRVVVTNHECGESLESDAVTVVVSPPSVCKTPTFSVPAGTYSSAQSVELSCGTDGATIRYTTNGDDPTESSSVYSSAISVSVNTTIKAKAFKAGLDASDVASATYNIRCAAPTFSLSDYGEYVGSQSLTMSSGTAGATIRYTTDDTEPTALSTAYSTAITVAGTSTIRAKAFKDGMTESEEAEVNVFIYCATPTFSVSAGTYNANQSVSISTTYGTTIYYTLDGSTPDTESSVYSTDITIDATKTLKAIAVKDGCENSEVASATYTLKCATPTFSPAAGTYTGAQSVALSCATDGSAIHYTTNGTDPTGSSATYSSAISVGTNQTVKAIATKSGWSNSEVASAAYTIKYNVAVASVDNVTISATTPSVAEGSSAAAAYGSTVSLSYSGVASGKTWGGWNVYKTGEASTKVVVTSNQFTMPDYNVTVSAIIYGDAIAWCDPEIEVTDADIHLTSYNGVPVYTTSGANNLIEISSSDFGSATRLEVAYLDADNADAEVDKAESVFRFCSSSDYSTIDGMDLDYELETNHSIRYTPSEYGVTNNYKLKLMFKRGDKVLKTVTHAIHGRSLPEEFVIASKFNDEWYALPNTMGTATETVTPLKITVDNTTTPTAATYAPETTVYKGAARKTATSNRNSIRLTNDGSHWLITNNSSAQLGLSGTETEGYENREVWYLKSSDFGAYTLKMDPAMSPTKQLGIYGGNMGMYATPTSPSGAIYLLPITNKYTEIAATVSEWGEHGVVVQPSTPSDLTGVASATMNIDDASPSTATTTAVNAGMGTAKRVRVYDDGGDLTVGAVANEGKLLYIHWKNSGGSEIGISQITIPTVIAASSDMSDIADTKAKWAAKSEIHVLPGVTLTADANSFAGAGALSVSNLHIYPGATLNVSSGTFNATTLRLHNGWTRAGEKAYDVARVYIADDAALTKTTASMDYDIYELTDGKHYYPLAVPFPVAVSAIDYADTYLAGFSRYGMDGQYVIKTYDGEQRAKRGGNDENWIDVPLKDEKEADVYLEPGKGYIITAISVKGEAIIRVPLDYNDAWTADGEKATAHYDDADHTKNVVAVTAWTGEASNSKKLHAGWNLLGLPYMSCYKTSEGTSGMETTAGVLTGKVNFSTTPISFEDDGFKYVSVPVHDFSEYIQAKITDANTELLPGWCFFVQIGTSGNLTFLSADQMASSSLPIYAPKRENSPVIETGIVLSNGEKSDNTTLIISDRYSAAEYEINADLEKMFGNAFTLSTYSMIGDAKFAYNALSTEDARQAIPLGVRIPADGEYTFTLNPQYAEADIERLDLIDYVAGEVTNLMTDSYTFTMTQGENTERFALNVTMRQETPTDIETVSGEGLEVSGARKMIINDKLYILRGGVMYDATGKKVSEVIRNK